MPNSNASLARPDSIADRLIVRGIHLDLTDALRSAATDKASRLLRHNDHIIRVRVDLEYDKTRGIGDQFIAKGHIEIGGPDLLASVASDDAYKSLDLLIDKLDGLLRRRHGLHKDKRNHPQAVELDTTLPKIE
jgi:putative sigma-54 modulation protein